ncbi:RNA polymerase sigma factor SigJ [Hoeflea sp. WL0058]|uniref:RNA polymerase sigma factor SigJ n=1 Tax=Flavimaribacter sediminis TaxID=2865987 RepID=A0AAE2ZRT1_9HYPH|nr:RNA polymerase sigma factor SigJ [Flavimaribacter sediminis]MBW8639328.1 RNA polymerase sigma factor SigJ [Flavimaribacter sediminis]
MPPNEATDRLEAFMAHRSRLLRLAYRHLGSVSEAEDIVQEAWLRFDGASQVDDPARLLSTIVTRLCLDRSKSADSRHLDYVGQWLPEPASGAAFETADDRSLDISFAVMRTLERLSAAERAAYFLHDLWDLSFEEISSTLSRSPEACRKLASRARNAIRQSPHRFSPSETDLNRFVSVFRKSVETGDPGPLKALLAEDAELVADGGGKKIAALNVIYGADAVSRFLFGIARKNPDPDSLKVVKTTINDAPSLIVFLSGQVDQTFAFDLDSAGRIAAIYIVRNPDKLAKLTRELDLR